jgi:hypothetical protein
VQVDSSGEKENVRKNYVTQKEKKQDNHTEWNTLFVNVKQTPNSSMENAEDVLKTAVTVLMKQSVCIVKKITSCKK